MSRVQEIFQKIKTLSQAENDELALLLADHLVPEANLTPQTKIEIQAIRVRQMSDAISEVVAYIPQEDLAAFVVERQLDVTKFKTAGIHLRLGDFDYWPKSGKWHALKTDTRGKGATELLALMKEFYR